MSERYAISNYEMTFEVMKDMDVLDVLVEACPVEPDVGIFGNGKVAISILDVGTLEFDAEKLEYYNKSIMNELSSSEIDDLAADIYSQLEDR